jgi:hypothetical protein
LVAAGTGYVLAQFAWRARVLYHLRRRRARVLYHLRRRRARSNDARSNAGIARS